EAPCVVYEGKVGKEDKARPFAINRDECTACSLCVRMLGCPAILVVNGVYTIDRELCDACTLCAPICRFGAIDKEAAERV
ncbi:MAG: 4Fe-4S binding protein, partial [Phycisphaerae bacterium]